MIDLHLLTRITSNDYGFLSMISQKICISNERFTREFQQSIENQNWNHTYFLLLEFYKKTSTYGTASFLSTVQNTLDIVKISDNQDSKIEACQKVIKKIEEGTDRLSQRFASITPQE